MTDRAAVSACPRCGKPMQLSFRNGTRCWVCEDFTRVSGGCTGYVPIAPDVRLSVAEIAADIGRVGAFDRSDEAVKAQATLRKAASACRTIGLSSKFLSSPEREVLAESVRVLERLATAVEMGKKRLKTAETERRIRREQEVRDRYVSLADRFLSGLDAPAALAQCECLAAYVNARYRYDEAGIGGLLKRADPNGDPAQRLAWSDLRVRVGDLLQDLRPDDPGLGTALSHEGFSAFQAEWLRRRGEDAAVASSPNVVRLAARKG